MPSGVQQFIRDAQVGSVTFQAFPNAFTAGNSAYILAQEIDTTSTAAVSDDGGNTYTPWFGPVTLGGTRYWIWRAAGISGTRPNLTLNAGAGTALFAGWEVSGDDATAPFDGSIRTATQNDASPTVSLTSLAAANELCLATLWTPGFGRAATLDASLTHVEGTQGPWGSAGYKTLPTTSETITGTVSSAITWYMIAMAIKASTPPPSGGAIIQNLMIG